MSPEPSDDELALLRSIEAAPDDDLPRLVYADWLDEHDRPIRAEFIRVECELAAIFRQLPELTREERRGFQTRLQQLKSRERQLSKVPLEVRLGIAGDLVKYIPSSSRGFADSFRLIDFQNLAAIGHILCLMIPRPRIEFIYTHESYSRSSMPIEAENVTQEIWDGVTDFTVNHLQDRFPDPLLPWMSQFHFPNLTLIDLYETAMEEIHFEQLCQLRVPQLKQLDLRENQVAFPRISLLVGSIFAKTLETLMFNYNAYNIDDFNLLKPENFPALKTLDIASMAPNDRRVYILLQRFPKLEFRQLPRWD